ncbi:hypothetical protein QR680_010793 [Steinernema hermaphroditum]|uniref:Snake toxin/toxin-like domain-containing protein n=1 Tax=Steinernema hermaphroditum TaxID=289476 RepID=A0AA39MC99_9BILA|nr:hypothetical protein QR680_010793 [Steinernema hermaphroditum]
MHVDVVFLLFVLHVTLSFCFICHKEVKINNAIVFTEEEKCRRSRKFCIKSNDDQSPFTISSECDMRRLCEKEGLFWNEEGVHACCSTDLCNDDKFYASHF